MAYNLFYMVGKSDVQINKMPVKQEYWQACDLLKKLINQIEPENIKFDIKNCRILLLTKPKITLQKVSITVSTIDFPIFASLYRSLEPAPDHYIILATQQRDTQFTHTDTLLAAEIMGLWIKKANLAATLEVVKIEDNPSDYDAMSSYFSRFIGDHQKLFDNSLANYFCLSSGTPAMILSFSLAALPYNMDYYYVPNDKRCESKSIYQFDRFRKQQYAQQLRNLIAHYHYATALEVINDSPFRADDVLVQIVRALAARQRFDWRETLSIAKKITGAARNHFVWISNLQEQKSDYFLLEMLARIEMSIKQEDLQVTLAWLFNILENSRNVLMQKYVGVEIKKVKDRFPEWENYIKISELFTASEKDDLLKYPPTRRSVLKVLEKYSMKIESSVSSKDDDQSNLKKAIQFLNKLERSVKLNDGRESTLQDLRNQGPFAHGSLGMEGDIFEKLWPNYGVSAFLQELKDFVCKLVSLPYNSNPFDNLNEIIFERLQ